jgi:integrase
MAKTKKTKTPKEPKTPKTPKSVKRSFVTGKTEDGTQKRIVVRGKTGKEAEAKLAEAKRLYARGLQAGELTVREWSERWKKSYKTDVSDHQKNHYSAKLKLDILPVIGDKRMKDITKEDLQTLMDSYKGGKKGTVEKIKQAICLLFADAADEGIIERDPAARLKKPLVVKKARRYLKSIERETLIKVAKTHPHGAFVLTVLYTGTRRGECLALLRSDVDLDKKRISITKALQMDGNRPKLAGTKSAEMKRAKTNEVTLGEDEGHRIVPIPDVLMPVLTKVCADKEPSDVLFPKTNGKYATQMAFNGWWRSIKRNCHITAGAKLYRNKVLIETSPIDDELTLHYLRHTYSQDMLDAQVDSFTRSALMGHSTKDTTANYTKLSDEAIDAALELMNKHLNSKDTGDKSGTNKNDTEL